MATHNATQGLIKVGSDTLGELKSFSFSENSDTIETSNLSSTAKTYAAGKTGFSGSAEAFWDNDDAGQTALSNGATTGDKFRTGTCIVSEISTSLSTEGMVEASFTFTGSGTLAESTVS